MVADRVVKRATRDVMWTSQVPPDALGHIAYGPGWEEGATQGVRDVGHGGGQQGTSTEILIAPEARAGVVVLINSDALGASDLAAKLLGLPAAEHKRGAVDPKVYDGYAGNYGVSSTMGIVREGDHLFVRLHGHLWTFARQLRINGCEPRTGARLPSCRRTPVRRTGNLPGRTNAPCRAASRWRIRKA
jgi:hypothetical protein